MIKVTRKMANIEMVVYVLEPGEEFPPALTPDRDKRPPLSNIDFIWDTTQGKLFEYYDNLIPHWQVADHHNWSPRLQKVLQEILDEGTAILKMRDICD